MSVQKTAQLYNSLNNLSRQREILKFAKKYGKEEGKIAIKEYKRFNIITILMIFLIMIPLIVYTFFSIDNSLKPNLPLGATQEKIGHVSLYSDTFWYTSNDEQYKFTFSDLNIENDFKPGSKIIIYLDEHDQIVSVAHEKSGMDIAIKILLMFVILISLFVTHIFVGRKTYAKNFVNYCKWYDLAIEPYKNKSNFTKIAENAKYQDVDTLMLELDEKTLQTYQMYKRINMILTILFFALIILIIYVYIRLDIEIYSIGSILFIMVYVLVFMILMNIIDSKIKKIKMKMFHSKSIS